MLTFSQVITKLLNQYKLICKKNLDNEAWIIKMDDLGLRRRQLRSDNEISLYYKAQRVVAELDQRMGDSAVSCWYSGIDEFHQHIKQQLSEYRIEQDKVVHTAQQASRALVEALQLINLPDAKRNQVIAKKLDQCGQIIAKYGSLEQQTMFGKTLRNFQQQDVNFFFPLQTKFEHYLAEMAAYFSGEEELYSS